MRILFFISFIALLSTGFSQNSVSLVSGNGKAFKVILEGKIFNQTPQAHVLIEQIKKDTLEVEFEFENKKKFPATIYLLEQGLPCKNKEFNYRLEYDDVSFHLRFTGAYDILPLPQPLVPVKPVIDTSLKYRNKIFGHLFELKEGKPVYFNNIPKDYVCLNPMPAEYMEHTAFLISKADVADQKYTIVENICRNNCFNVSQLSTLVNYIDYEIEKLKIIRLAYPHLTDPANKKELDKNFRFESSRNELAAFLSTADETKLKTASGCTSAASQMVVDNYAEKLAAFGNDAERFQAFRKGYGDLCYSSDQVNLILSKFIHDREKLDAAKLLYFSCVEKDKFMKVSDVFSYNETISELKDFVEKQGQ